MHLSKGKIALHRVTSALKILLGICLVLFFGMALCGAFLDFDVKEMAAILVCVAFFALGIWLIVSGRRRQKLIALAKRCDAIVDGLPAYSVSRLAQDLQSPEAVVRSDLAKMIRCGYFPNARFEFGTDHILFGQYPQAQSAPVPVQKVGVICQACGGANSLQPGQSGVCEYCGSGISAP